MSFLMYLQLFSQPLLWQEATYAASALVLSDSITHTVTFIFIWILLAVTHFASSEH